MVINIQVNTVSGNGLLPDGTKPLPEPVLTWASLGLYGNHLRPMSLELLKISDHKIGWKNTLVKLFLHLPRAHEFILGVRNRFALLYYCIQSTKFVSMYVCIIDGSKSMNESSHLALNVKPPGFTCPVNNNESIVTHFPMPPTPLSLLTLYNIRLGLTKFAVYRFMLIYSGEYRAASK